MAAINHERLGELWMLLCKDPKSLSDQEIGDLLAAQEELEKHIFALHWSFPFMIEAVRRYRERKKELAEKSTEELQGMYQNVLCDVAHTRRENLENGLSDPFSKPSDIDSDEYILDELLKERGVNVSASWRSFWANERRGVTA